ncbi:MAG: hypothetical protein ACI4V7_10245 [Succinivibrionaceae bacterium]
MENNNDFYIPINKIKTANCTDGVNWAINSFISIKSVKFWVIVLIVFITGLISSTVSIFPILPSIISTLGVAACFTYLVKKRFLTCFEWSSILNTTLKSFWSITIYTLLKMLLRFLLYFLGIVVVIVLSWDRFWNFVDIIISYISSEYEIFQNQSNEVYKNSNYLLFEILHFIAYVIKDLITNNTALFQLVIYHTLISFMVSMIVELIVYMADFFAIPLILFSKANPLQAMWLSFKAINKNIMSITAFGLAYIFIYILIGIILYFISQILAFFGIVLALLGGISAMAVLNIMHLFVQYEATVKVFWSDSIKK